LEELGIGRPSTFATIVDTIIERGYVKKCDLEGNQVDCNEYKVEGGVVKKTIQKRTFGNEKNKLVLQPVGKMTIEYLLQHFEPLFNYAYTKNMEDALDTVSSGKNADWSAVCRNCYAEIKALSDGANQTIKRVFPLEPDYDFMFEKFGPVVRHTLSDGTFEYFPAKKEVNYDLEKLKAGGYTLTDVLEVKARYLGKYENQDLHVKTGRYGPYVEWGNKKESIKTIDKAMDAITLEDIVTFFEKKGKGETMNILRVLNPFMSVRKGKFGAYVYYKTEHMKSPQFFNMSKFKKGFSVCDLQDIKDWLKNTYNI
jgi:DNA topoisomerase-1